MEKTNAPCIDARKEKRDALEKWATELQAILESRGRTDRKAEVVELAHSPLAG